MGNGKIEEIVKTIIRFTDLRISINQKKSHKHFSTSVKIPPNYETRNQAL